MKSVQVVVRLRFGAGAMPCRRRMLPTVWSDTRCPKLPRAPTIRSYPHPEFSRASRTTSSSISGLIRGRPTARRCFEPPNLCAMSRRYQARMVSGPATQATCCKRLPTESLTDLGQRGPLSIVQSQDLFTMRFQDPILRREVLVLQQQFLIDQTGRIGQQTYHWLSLIQRFHHKTCIPNDPDILTIEILRSPVQGDAP